eukprot:g11297.t1
MPPEVAEVEEDGRPDPDLHAEQPAPRPCPEPCPEDQPDLPEAAALMLEKMVADMDVLTNLLQSIEARMAHTEATTAELAQLLKHRAAESSVDTSAPSPGRATSRGGSHVGPVFFGVLLFVVGGVDYVQFTNAHLSCEQGLPL